MLPHTEPTSDELRQRAAAVRLLVLDVDGVLTDGTIVYGQNDTELKSFHTHDGLGVKLALGAGLAVALVTGRTSTALERRAGELGVAMVMQGVRDKVEAVKRIAGELSLGLHETAFLGDDLIDIPAMRTVGLPAAVGDAVDEVKSVAQLVTTRKGGRGAVREAIEFILKAKGVWHSAVAPYMNLGE